MVENEKRRSTDQGESTLTIKWGAIIILILGFFGWVVIGTFSHENRITTMETKLAIHIPVISTSLEKMAATIEEIRDNQLRLQRKEK